MQTSFIRCGIILKKKYTMKPKLIILTGPQGAGNHLWSKIFSIHSDVIGWKELLEADWLGHKDEPYMKFWQDPELLHDEALRHGNGQGQYYVTSISCPYQIDGELIIPNYKDFASVASNYCDIQFVILGRDQNILEKQENRIRGSKTYDLMKKELAWIADNYVTHFVSMELLYLYKRQYLEGLAFKLQFPIDYSHPLVNTMLQEDANKKYIQPLHIVVGKYDRQAKKSSGLDER